MAKTPQQQAGFTLVELLIGFAITVIVVFILAGVTQELFTNLNREQERQALLDETRRSVDLISDYTLKASAVLANFTTPDDITYATGGDTLILAIPADDANGNPLSGVVDTVVIGLTDDSSPSLHVIVFPATGSQTITSDRTPTERVTNFTITYYSTDSNGDGLDDVISDPTQSASVSRIEASLTTEQPLRNQTLSETLIGGGRLRNRQ